MINFFRKIRQKLLTENKFSRYLLYAIGEIILVVIGILIALQLNNLNEERKINNQEKILLAELVNNLDENITLFEKFIIRQNREVHFADSILNHFKNNTATDSLSNIFSPLIWNTNLYLSFSTFETIKTIGFDLIRNDQIRLNIIGLFEVNYPRRMNAIRSEGLETYYEWHFQNGHLRNRIFNSTLYRNDENYQSMNNFIELRRGWKSAMIKTSTNDMEKTIALKQLIEDYLKQGKRKN